jgi:NAD(P)H-dependent FMN reductase
MPPYLEIIVISTRNGRKGPAIAKWFDRQARQHGGFEIEYVDLAEINLPLFDEPEHPRFRKYQHEHTKAWSARVERADAFVFVTPEYNFSAPPSLVNALDYLVQEWAYKPVGLVSYGGVSGGLRAAQMIRQIVTGFKMVPMLEAVAIPFFTKSIDAGSGEFLADETQVKAARAMLDELLRWTNALAALRAPAGGTAGSRQ